MILRRGTCELHSGKLPLILLSEPLEPTQCNVDPLDSKEEARLSRSYDVDSPLAQSAAGIAQTSVLSLTPAAGLHAVRVLGSAHICSHSRALRSSIDVRHQWTWTRADEAAVRTPRQQPRSCGALSCFPRLQLAHFTQHPSLRTACTGRACWWRERRSR